ncbi:MAG: 2-oxoacid:acceptor oxidoreductase subunit alpha [Bacillota bacterium]
MPILMQGNAAIAEAALRAGTSFYAGYPITPSSEIAEIMARRLPAQGGIYLQMEDELASMAAIIGASLAGARSLTATSGPGFSLMQENLGMAVMAEVPCVIVNVQRSGPSTGLATRPGQADVMQARWGRHGDAPVIALCPSSVQDCFDQTVRAFLLAEDFRCPVVIMPDEAIAHLSEGVELREVVTKSRRRWPTCPPQEYLPFSAGPGEVPPLAEYGSPYVFHVTSSMHDETGFSQSDPETARRKNLRLYHKIHDRVEDIADIRYTGPPAPRVLVIAYGITARAARAAVWSSQDAGVLELATLWPLFEARLAEIASTARLVLVPEMNLGQMVHEVRRIVRHCPVHGLHRCDGEPIEPSEISRALRDLGGDDR